MGLRVRVASQPFAKGNSRRPPLATKGWDAGMTPEAELANPTTTAERLAEIAQDRYDLHGQILAHPNCYPGLAEWIVEASPGVTAVDATRGLAEAETAVLAPPAEEETQVIAAPDEAETQVITGPGETSVQTEVTSVWPNPQAGMAPTGAVPARPQMSAGAPPVQPAPMYASTGAAPMQPAQMGARTGAVPMQQAPMYTQTGPAPVGPGAQPASESIWKKPWFIVGIVVLAVLAVAGIVFAIYALTSGGKEERASGGVAEITKRASEARPKLEEEEEGPEKKEEEDKEVVVPDDPEPVYPGASIPGAYADAGGPRPASAVPISSVYDMEYMGTFATIVTPSGNIGCDFTWDMQGCGVLSYLDDQPYGGDDFAGANWWIWFTDGAYPTISGKGDVALFMFPEYPAQVVEYGQVVYWEDIVCSSSKDGLTCWNTNTGHGAFMNRDGFTGF